MISFHHIFHVSYISLAKSKARTFLTILGIVIGIAAVILVMSIGQGAENLILEQINAFGAETVTIQPGKEPKGPSDFAGTLFGDSLKVKDIEELRKKSNVPDAADVVPEVLVSGSVSYRGEIYGKAFIFGFDAEYMAESMNLEIGEGESFDEVDINIQASKAIIGVNVKEKLFGNDDAVGQNITIKNRKFKVIGVYKPRGTVVGFNIDDLVLVPYSTAQTYLSGADYYSEVIIKASSAEKVDVMVLDIKRTLRELHGITDPEDDDFHVITQEKMIDQVKGIIGAFSMFLSLVVAVSLVVGGIGVMNVMLVSVTERTPEIGLRKAVGATDRDINYQFLLESVILTLLGGVIGIIVGVILGFSASFLIKYFFNFSLPFAFPWMGAVLGVVVSSLVGLIFGIYPARKAAKKSPIAAIRYE